MVMKMKKKKNSHVESKVKAPVKKPGWKAKLRLDGTAGTIFYVVVGILLAFGINQALAFGLRTEMPVVAVESNSMVPTFYRGDILIIQGAASPQGYQDFVQVGDVIVFTPPGKQIPIVHRVIAKNPDGTFQTRGDANNGQQLPFEKSIQPGEIEGKMVLLIPYLGWIKIGMTEYVIPFIAANILAVIAVLATISFIYYWAKNIRV
jgi:signal peptidase